MEQAETHGSLNHNAKETKCREEFKEKASEIKENVVEAASLAKGAAIEVAQDLQHRGTDSLSHLSESVKQGAKPMVRYIQKNPAKAMAIGVGAGLIFGSILARKGN